MERILVGTDFSPEADAALDTAAAFARGKGAALRIVHVLPPTRSLAAAYGANARTVSAIRAHAMSALKGRADSIDPERRLEISTGLTSGAASLQLHRGARDFGANLLVIGARGEHEGSRPGGALGGTASKLLTAAPVPLLLARTSAAGLPDSALVALDLSAASHAVLAAARVWLAPNGVLVAFHAYDPPAAARLEAYGLARSAIDLYADAEQQRRGRELESLVDSASDARETKLIVGRGGVADMLLRQIDAVNPALVVLGRPGKPGRGAARRAAECSRAALLAARNLLVVPVTR